MHTEADFANNCLDAQLIARSPAPCGANEVDAAQALSGGNYELAASFGIVSASKEPRCPAAFTNSSHGGRGANAEFEEIFCRVCNVSTLFLRSTKDIEAGVEILCDYIAT